MTRPLPPNEHKLLTEAQVQAAFDWIINNAKPIAAAKGTLVRAEWAAKKTFASLFRSATGSVEARKAWATDHPDYEKAMEAVHAAVEHWELMQNQKNAAATIIEAWRTQEATERDIRRMR